MLSVTLGGDHYITLPILEAYAATHGPLSVIQFDAHSDLWPDDDMTRIDHGTMMYKAVKRGFVDPARSVQIGIRTECADYLGVQVIDARTAHEKGPAWVAAKAKEIVGEARTYVTFDIDALDPPSRPAPAPRSGAGWQAGRRRRSCATWRASTWSAATWWKSLPPSTRAERRRWPGRMSRWS